MHPTVFFTSRTMGASLVVPEILKFGPKFQNLEFRSFALVIGPTYALTN